jgi:hypothetical protein
MNHFYILSNLLTLFSLFPILHSLLFYPLPLLLSLLFLPLLILLLLSLFFSLVRCLLSTSSLDFAYTLHPLTPSPLFLPSSSHSLIVLLLFFLLPPHHPFSPIPCTLAPHIGRACSDSTYGRNCPDEQSACTSLRRPYSRHVHAYGAVCGSADFPHMGDAGLDAQVLYYYHMKHFICDYYQ